MEYAELNENQKDEVLNSSMNLMRTITDIWGAERGMELWDSIATTLGQDVKGAIFFAMLTGEGLGDVILTKVNTNQAIETIKAIRAATGMGLKEAKDTYDAARDKGFAKFSVYPKERVAFLKQLRNIGCTAR
jgi:ribosomal protein L7/L12